MDVIQQKSPEATSIPKALEGDANPGKKSSALNLPEGTFEPDIYLKIDRNDILTVTAFRSEMGQGIRTALAMMIADELDMPWEKVVIEQAPADPAYGDQVTGGSASISTSQFESSSGRGFGAMDVGSSGCPAMESELR